MVYYQWNNNKKSLFHLVKLNGYLLKNVNNLFKKDKEFILEIVKLNGYLLKYADISLKKR